MGKENRASGDSTLLGMIMVPGEGVGSAGSGASHHALHLSPVVCPARKPVTISSLTGGGSHTEASFLSECGARSSE